MLAFDVERVRAINTAQVSTGTDADENHPLWEKSGDEYFYKNKLFVDDLGRAMIDRVVLSIGGYEIEDLTGKLDELFALLRYRIVFLLSICRSVYRQTR